MRTEQNDGEWHEIHHVVHHRLLWIGYLLIGRAHHAGLDELEHTCQHRQDEVWIGLSKVGKPQEAVSEEPGA